MNPQDLQDTGVLLEENTLLKKKLEEYEAKLARLSEKLAQERVAKEQASEEASAFRLLLDNIPQKAWTALPDGSINYFNQRWYEYTSQTPEKALDAGWQIASHLDDLPNHQEVRRKMIMGQEHVWQNRLLRASDGMWRWHQSQTKAIRDESGDVVLWIGTSTDIHEQLEAERILRESEERFRFMADSIPQIVWTALPNGYEDFHNSRLTEYTGMDSEVALGSGWQQMVHPEDLTGTLLAWQKSLTMGVPYYVKYRLRRHDGVYRWFLGKALPLKDEAGNVIKWFGTCTDIHHDEEAKLQLQNANHELSRVNEVLDTFVYMAAHDLKSPVSNLKTLMQMADQESNPDHKQDLNRMIDISVNRLEQTINGLLEVISVESNQFPAREVSFNQVYRNILTEHAVQLATIKEGIQADFSRCEHIRYNEAFVHSILKNLITNAVKYRSPKRPLQLRITTQPLHDGVLLTVADNGIGIDLKANGDRIFKPFKRFTEQAPGTGVGLYIIKTIVERNGGSIKVESTLDAGTTFQVHLKPYA